jgi:hypothetical protein
VSAPEVLAPFVSPQFYHLVSPIKKVMMMLAFSLFAEYYSWQLGVVCALQLLEFVRLALIRPYLSPWRNLLRGTIDGLMAAQFAGLIWLGYMSEDLTEDNFDLFNSVGWALLAINYAFNLYFLGSTIYSLVEKCRGEHRLIVESRQR